ncbi:hypothetical protein D9615_010201 [Tricholomella constricta]|uniref:Chromo domain-containing protein n=1 Tax=Tricholomella constricta TaxID=117010 RepID=A0A8H5GNP0_9AGAR|nr:hypothetical protein D9615_010201 [Tricholomella constricta]
MPNSAANDQDMDSIVTAIKPLLMEYQKYMSARFDKIEAVLENLSGHVQQVNVNAQMQTKQLAEAGVPYNAASDEGSDDDPDLLPATLQYSVLKGRPNSFDDGTVPACDLALPMPTPKQSSTLHQHIVSPLFLPESFSPSPQPTCNRGSPPPKQSSEAPQQHILSSSPSPMMSIEKPLLAKLKSLKEKQPTKAKAKVEPVALPHMSTLEAPHIVLKIKLPKLKKTQDGQSTTVTGDRKRKVKESMQKAMEPPLKRARQKFGDEEEEWQKNGKHPKTVAVEVPARSGKGKEKEKEKRGGRSKEKSGTPPSSTSTSSTSPSSTSTSTKGLTRRLRCRVLPTGCKWPIKNITADKKFNQRFVECDGCLLWYHYACVGIIDLKDVRIKGGELFMCPPCSAGGANPMLASKNIICARPDCGEEEKRSDEYFMTGIVGRSTREQRGKIKYVWLVKWDGYSIKECTWEDEDGMSDPQSFIQDFNETALLEGVDPEADQHSTILLSEAIAGGWVDPNA